MIRTSKGFIHLHRDSPIHYQQCSILTMPTSYRDTYHALDLMGEQIFRKTCLGNQISRGKWSEGAIFMCLPWQVSFQAMRSHASTGAIGTKTLTWWTSLVLYKGHCTAVPLFPLPVYLREPWRLGKRLRSGNWRPPRRRASSHPGPSRGELISSLEGWQGKWAHAFGCDLELTYLNWYQLRSD